MRLHLLCLLAATTTVASAQSTLVLPSGLVNGTGNSLNSFPWGTSAANFPGLRVQTVYDSSNFVANGVATPIRITRLRWRANDSTSTWTGGTFAQGRVVLATATVDHSQVGTNFAQNLGTDQRVAYSGPVSYLGGVGNGVARVGPVVVDITLATPFVYDPAAGDLAIDVDYPGGGNFSGGTLSAMDVQTGAAASRTYASTTHPIANGTTVGHGAVVQVDYVPATGLFAAFQKSTGSGGTPLAVHFTDASYSSEPGGVRSWAWDFDDDSTTDSTEQNPTWTFTTCGRHTVSLTVGDGRNAPSTSREVDCVVTDEVVADFTWRVMAQGVVLFTDNSSPTPTNFAWDFDGDHVVDANAATALWVFPSDTALSTVSLTVQRLCGAPATVVKSLVPGSAILTTFAGGNGLAGSGAGNVFDLEVLDPVGINLKAITVAPLATTLPFGSPIGCDLWLTDAAGGFALAHAQAPLWRHVAIGRGTFVGGNTTLTTVPTPLALDRPVFVPPGRYSMAIHMNNCGLVYSTGTSATQLEFTNGEVHIACGLAKSAPFSTSANSPRIWNGILHYDLGSRDQKAGYGWFAAGCATSGGIVPHIVPTGLPVAGQPFTLQFDDLPQDVAFAMLGFSRQQAPFGPLPFDLAAFGAPGCALRTSPDLSQVLFGSAHSATLALVVPSDPAAIGVPFFAQALVLDPLANAAAWVSSDAWAGVIGL